MEVGDGFCQHLVPQSALAGRAVPPRPPAMLSDPQDLAGGFGADALPGQGWNDREPPFGRMPSSLSIEVAHWVLWASRRRCTGS